jgi:hypothetical protein
MACEAKILLRIAEPGDAARIREAGLGGHPNGDWHEIAAADDEATARRLSKSLALVTVWLSIHAAARVIELKCFAKGNELRHLLYTGDDGWIARAGEPLPYEATAVLERWLDAPRLLAGVRRYDVLTWVLGRAQDLQQSAHA